MKILAMDSCTEVCNVCVTENGNVIAEYISRSKRTHSERLMPAIDQIFANLNWPLQEIDCLAVIHGPGSFTGLRIALSVVKGLSYGLQKPVVAMNALEVAAAQVKVDGLVSPVMDARRGEIFTCLFEKHDSQLIRRVDPKSIPPDLWKEDLPPEPVHFCGPGLYLYKERLQNHSQSTFEAEDFVLARTLAFLAENKFRNGEAIAGNQLRAAYLRPSDAEAKGPRARKKLEHIPRT